MPKKVRLLDMKRLCLVFFLISSALQAAGTALLVVGNTTLNAGDTAISNALSAQGYSVVLVGDAASAASDATGKALVFISESS